jgi:hypothetical protein
MRRTWAAWIGAVAVAGTVTGCSSSSTPTDAAASSAVSSDRAVCQTADELRSSLAAVKDVDVVAQGTDGLKQAFAAVRSDLQQLRQDSAGQFSEQIDAVQADADAVQAAVDAAQSDPSAQTLGTVASSVGALVTGGTALVDAVGSTC